MKQILSIKQSVALLFVSISLFGIVSAALAPQIANAQAATVAISKSSRSDVLDHQLYYFVKRCFLVNDVGSMSVSDVRGWKWFNNKKVYNEKIANQVKADEDFSNAELAAMGAATFGAGAVVGQISNFLTDDKKYFLGSTRGGMYDNGIVNCEGKWVEEAFSRFGFTDGLDTFCSLDFTFNTKTGGNEPGEGKGKGKQGCLDGQNSSGKYDAKANYNDQAKGFDKLVLATAAGKKAEGALSQPAEYYRRVTSLINGCHIEIGRVITDEELNGNNPAANNDELFDVPLIDQKGTVIHYLGTSTDGWNDGMNVPFVATLNNNGWQKKSCGQLAIDSRNLAPAAAAYIATADPSDIELVDPTTLSATTTTGKGGSGGSDPSCYSESGPLAWVLCAALEALDGAIGALDTAINNLLFVNEDVYSSVDIEQSWAVIRNIALLVLVPMMVFMVIGTALNFGPFDPYTVKKALPRMLFAVVFIVLSLPVTQFGVELSNTVGQGAGNLILSASPNKVTSLHDIVAKTGANDSTGAAIFVPLVLYGLGGGITIGIVGSFAIVTLVALLIGFVILVMRQVLILMLIVVAPLAILVWIFPGNDKLWGIWKTTFIAMLMMYPLIAVLIASGRFVAGIANF